VSPSSTTELWRGTGIALTVELGDEGVLGAPAEGAVYVRRGDQVTYDSLFNAIMGEC